MVALTEAFSNRLIQILYQPNLFEAVEVFLHELAEFHAEDCHSLSVTAHIGERNPGYFVFGTYSQVMNIAASAIRPHHRMCPCG